jgi:putative permease
MKEKITITLDSASIVKVLTWIVVFAGLFYINDLIVALLVAVVLASAAEMPVRVMMKWGVPRGVSVSVLFLSLFLLLAATALIFIPPLADDIARFIKTLPKILESVRIFGKDMGFKDLSVVIQGLSQDISKGQILTILKNAVFGSSGFFATTSVVVASVINLVLTFVLSFYLALEERGVQKFLRLIAPKVYESYIEDLWARAQKKIGLSASGCSCILRGVDSYCWSYDRDHSCPLSCMDSRRLAFTWYCFGYLFYY